MHVIFHTGVHFTDDERLLKCLLRNKEIFAKQGISVPGPSRYRPLLKDAFKAMLTASPAPDARDVLIDAILDDEVADRLILSNSHFFGSQNLAIGNGVFYPDAARQLQQIQTLFHSEKIEMFMAICNPATFLPAVIDRVSARSYGEMIGDTHPRDLLWHEMILRIRAAVPDIALTIWCNEDTPLIWAQILREMAGLAPDAEISGGFDLLNSIMSDQGINRFQDYLKKFPDMSEIQQRRVISAFLDKFALEDKVEKELNLPGWTDALVEELTDIYDEDVLRIQRIPGVHLIAP